MLKAQNSLVMMVLKMCGTGIFVRKHAVSSPQVGVWQQGHPQTLPEVAGAGGLVDLPPVLWSG